MTRPRSPQPGLASKTEPSRSAKALSLARDGDAELAELTARFEVQRRELHESSLALTLARSRITQGQRQLAQVKSRLEEAEERATQTEEEAARLFARAEELEARLERAASEAHERLLREHEATPSEVATLRDALAAALERERVFRRVEAELRRRVAELSSQGEQSTWGSEMVDGVPLVP